MNNRKTFSSFKQKSLKKQVVANKKEQVKLIKTQLTEKEK